MPNKNFIKMKVKNINGTSQTNCSCGSWLQHWRKYSNQNATICRASGCSRTDLVGAHVQKDEIMTVAGISFHFAQLIIGPADLLNSLLELC